MKKDIKGIETTPFGGGADIRHQNEPALITSGGYSTIQNMRNMYPGLKKRGGCSKLHDTADGGTPKNKVMSLYQFVKGKKTERHFFAQMSDSDVLESYANPPTMPELMTLDTAPASAWADGVTVTGVTSTATCVIADYVTTLTYIVRDRSGTFTSGEVLGTGTLGADNQANQGLTYPAFTSPDFALGAEVFSGTASPVPASYANVNDLLLFANGVDTPQIYPGTASPVEKFIVYKGAAAIPTIPEIGDDYTTEVTDGLTATVAVLASLGDLAADYDCIFIMTPVPIDTLNFTIGTANTGASTTGANFWNGSAWTAVSSFNDTTDADSKTLAVNGTMTWTLPTTHVPSFMYGTVGFWYQIYLATGDLSAGATVSAVTYESDWQAMQNVWDGEPVPIVESQLYQAADANYETYGNSAIDIGGAASGDLLYIASADPICAIIIDVGETPISGQDIATVKYWNGAWTGVTGISDGTAGLSHSGWITFAQQSDVQKYRFNNSSYYAYWYQITIPQMDAAVCLNFDGDDAATTFTDLSGKTWTAVGTAQLDTAQKAFGTASLLLDGDSDSITTTSNLEDFNFTTGDFTVEWWWRCGDVTGDRWITPLSCYQSATNFVEISVLMDTAGKDLTFYVRSDVAGTTVMTATCIATMTFTVNTWYHLAAVRKSGTVGCFVDGVTTNIISTGVSGSIFYDGATFYRIGYSPAQTQYSDYWTDGLRISKYAVYTPGTDFTKPDAAPVLAVNGIIPTNTTIAADTEPYFDITEIGKGQTVCSWKNRASISTNLDHFMYLSAENAPQVLYGSDTALLAPGDGRYNRPVAQRKLNDDLLVFQEEKGTDGGCITKYSWVTSVDDIKKTLVSNTLGAMNAKVVDIVDGVEFAELNRDASIMSLAFFLSRSGVYVTDGSVVYMISQDIANYFDPNDAACIRAGYEKEHWLKYDSAYGVIRLGLVSGSSFTVPNVWPVYDVKLKTWVSDSLAQEFSCMTEVEAGSGSIPVVQVGGGTDDGFVYLLNTGTNDVTTAINSYATLEFDLQGYKMCMSELLLRVKSQTAGDVTVTPYVNGQAQTALTLSMTAATANDQHRRHRTKTNLIGDHISLKFQHNTVSQDCYLLDCGTAIEVYNDQ